MTAEERCTCFERATPGDWTREQDYRCKVHGKELDAELAEPICEKCDCSPCNCWPSPHIAGEDKNDGERHAGNGLRTGLRGDSVGNSSRTPSGIAAVTPDIAGVRVIEQWEYIKAFPEARSGIIHAGNDLAIALTEALRVIEGLELEKGYAKQPNGDGEWHSADYWMRCFDSSQAERCRLNVALTAAQARCERLETLVADVLEYDPHGQVMGAAWNEAARAALTTERDG
jgi:hypothetical protein